MYNLETFCPNRVARNPPSFSEMNSSSNRKVFAFSKCNSIISSSVCVPPNVSEKNSLIFSSVIDGEVTIRLSRCIRNERGLIILDSIGSGSPSTYLSKSNS